MQVPIYKMPGDKNKLAVGMIFCYGSLMLGVAEVTEKEAILITLGGLGVKDVPVSLTFRVDKQALECCSCPELDLYDILYS